MGALTIFPGKGNCHSCGGQGWRKATGGKRLMCPVCGGTGKSPHVKKKKKVCDQCHGTGKYSYTSDHWTAERKFTKLSGGKLERTGKAKNIHTVTCDQCHGTGQV